MGCELTQVVRLFSLAARAPRLPRVPYLLPSTSFRTRVRVLANFGGSALEYNEKTGPNPYGRDSPKLRPGTILRPALEWQRVYDIPSAPVNTFDNAEKTVPVRAVSLVRNRDGGGETGIRTPGTLSRSTVFKTAAFDHSATSPRVPRMRTVRTPFRRDRSADVCGLPTAGKQKPGKSCRSPTSGLSMPTEPGYDAPQSGGSR